MVSWRILRWGLEVLCVVRMLGYRSQGLHKMEHLLSVSTLKVDQKGFQKGERAKRRERGEGKKRERQGKLTPKCGIEIYLAYDTWKPRTSSLLAAHYGISPKVVSTSGIFL